MSEYGHALRLQEVPLAEVAQFYGDRFVKLTRYPDALHIVRTREGWEDFYHLWEELRGYKGSERAGRTARKLAGRSQSDQLPASEVRKIIT